MTFWSGPSCSSSILTRCLMHRGWSEMQASLIELTLSESETTCCLFLFLSYLFSPDSPTLLVRLRPPPRLWKRDGGGGGGGGGVGADAVDDVVDEVSPVSGDTTMVSTKVSPTTNTSSSSDSGSVAASASSNSSQCSAVDPA